MTTNDLIINEIDSREQLLALMHKHDPTDPAQRKHVAEVAMRDRNVYRLLEAQVGHIDPIMVMMEA